MGDGGGEEEEEEEEEEEGEEGEEEEWDLVVVRSWGRSRCGFGK